VILVSTDASLLALFERAASERDRVVAATEDELRTALASKAETVVIDVPASERRETWQRVRALHGGMVLVVVDDQSETKDWPSDLARRFLVRPLVEDEIVTALAVRPKILREPAAARRRRLAQRRRPPVVPPPIAPPDPPPGGVEPVRRLSPEENLWTETRPDPPAPAIPAPPATPAAPSPGTAPPGASAPSAPPAPTAPAAPPTATEQPALPPPRPSGVPAGRDRTPATSPAGADHQPPAASATPAATPILGAPPRPAPAVDRTSAAGGRRPATPGTAASRASSAKPAGRRAGLVAAGIVTLLLLTTAGGIAVGRATADPGRGAADAQGAATSSIPGTSTLPTTASPAVVFKTPAACDAALSDADAALSYLVGNVRDDRLTKSMQSYQQNRKACREAAR
jgi:hypothetical protein